MDTKYKIIEAAKLKFLTKGYCATTMEDIANASNVNKALINYHFQNKEHLYKHIIKSIIAQEIHPLLENIIRDSSIENRVHMLNYISKLIVKNYPWILMIVINERDPLHHEILSLIGDVKPFSSAFHSNTPYGDDLLNTIQRSIIILAFSTFPRIFENFLKALLHIDGPAYEKIIDGYHNQLARLMDDF